MELNDIVIYKGYLYTIVKVWRGGWVDLELTMPENKPVNVYRKHYSVRIEDVRKP